MAPVKLKIILIISFVLFGVSIANANWAIRLSAPEFDLPNDLRQTSDGGYVVAGMTYSFGAGNLDGWIVKLDASGRIQWQKTYGGFGWESIHTILQTDDGGYITVGQTDSFGAGGNDAWLMKLDARGTVQWQKTYGGISTDRIYSLVKTSDCGYIMVGQTASFGVDPYDTWVVKLNAGGGIQWQRVYGEHGVQYASSVRQTPDGGYIVLGSNDPTGAGDFNVWLIKLDAMGLVEWQKTYGGSKEDISTSIELTSNNGYIFAGITHSFGAGSADAWIVRLDAIGNIQWQKTYGGSGWDTADSVQQTTDGGYIFAGSTDSFGNGKSDAWLVKLDMLGNIQWQKTYGGLKADGASRMQIAFDGGYIFIGTTDSFGSEQSDIWVVKLANTGAIPGCRLMKNSAATVDLTTASVAEPAIIVSDTNVTPVVTSRIPAVSSTSKRHFVCQSIKKSAKSIVQTGPVSQTCMIKAPLVSRFLMLKSGVIEDSTLGVQWAPSNGQEMDYDQAENYVDKLNLDGGGWRLPTRSELKSLYDSSVKGHAISVFNINENWVWTSEFSSPSFVWVFFFTEGYEDAGTRVDSVSNSRVLAVRAPKTKERRGVSP